MYDIILLIYYYLLPFIDNQASDTSDNVKAKRQNQPGSSKDVKASDTIDPLPKMTMAVITGAQLRACRSEDEMDALLTAKIQDKKGTSDTIDEKAKRQDEKGSRDEVVIFIILITLLHITCYY